MTVKPYYADDLVTLFNADALETPALVLADILLTDPPYSRAGAISTGRTTASGVASDAQGSDQFWLHWFNSVVARIVGHLRPSGCGFVFTDYRTINLVERAFALSGHGWSVSQGLVWDRESIGLGSPFRASHELIAFVRGPEFVWYGRKDHRNVFRSRWPYGSHEHHPAEKPVALLKTLLEATARPGDVVLDPFAGSGSTLVAAKELGLVSVGVEMEETFCEIAAKRLGQEVLGLEMPA